VFGDEALQKTITFRLLATISTFLIAWQLTGSQQIGASVGIAQAGVNTAIYYLHEKAWNYCA